ncbi:MAG TPA: Maf-like protein, partial [Bacteroidetes bacterium]|nr:Maf-like protein [Bacteroidota bacterium]
GKYLDLDHPYDKAGAYGIQDHSALFVEKIDGCYYNVVGFPLTKFYVRLKEFLNQGK